MYSYYTIFHKISSKKTQNSHFINHFKQKQHAFLHKKGKIGHKKTALKAEFLFVKITNEFFLVLRNKPTFARL